MDLRKEIERRDLNQHNAFLFAIFAGMVDLGLVNQGIINELAKKTAEYMINYYSAKDVTFELEGDSLEKSISSLFHFFNGDLNFVKKYGIERSDGGIRVSVDSQFCKICPKGLGGAEIKGTLCLIPHFFMHLMNHYLPQTSRISLRRGVPTIVKDSGNCIVSYDLAE